MDRFALAVCDYHGFLERGYPEKALLKLVGDRYRLSGEQRSMLFRGVCIAERAAARKARRVDDPAILRGARVHVDLYNVLYTLLSYRAGRPLFIGMDGFLRDAAETHGKIRDSGALEEGVELLVGCCIRRGVGRAEFYLDSPVAFSGELAVELSRYMKQRGVRGQTRVVRSADYELKHVTDGLVATSDSAVIDACRVPVVDLARVILEARFAARFPDLRMHLYGGSVGRAMGE